jgi:beta-lactamase class A
MSKVLLPLEVAEAFAQSTLRPEAELRVSGEQFTSGGTGLNQFAPPVTISLQDLLFLPRLVRQHRLGPAPAIRGARCAARQSRDSRAAHLSRRGPLQHPSPQHGRGLRLRLGLGREQSRLDTPVTSHRLGSRTYDPSLCRELTRLATLLALEHAASAGSCRLVRDLMSRQAWTGRFAAAFPSSRWSRSSKTGTLAPWPGEFGVVTRDDGVKLSIAATRPSLREPLKPLPSRWAITSLRHSDRQALRPG